MQLTYYISVNGVDVAHRYFCHSLCSVFNFVLNFAGAKQKTRENLKEMCDVQSGMASAIIQIYLKQVSQENISKNISSWKRREYFCVIQA